MNENEVLQQSLELNRIQAELIKEKNRAQRMPWIVCIVVSICALLMVGFMLLFFSQYEFYYEEVTVTQDTAEGGGNNNYFAADTTYNEGEEIDGETNG